MARTGKIVNKRGLAEVFGVSTQAIDGWLTRGCPVVEKGAPLVGYKFDTAAVAEWRSQQAIKDAIGAARPSDGKEALERKTAAEASLAELKLHRELGRLVTLEDVERVWSRLTASCRARLLSVPSKVAAMARAAGSNESARAAIENAIAEALDELGNGGIADDGTAGDDGAMESGGSADSATEAAAEADAQPVGGRETKVESRGKRRARTVDNGAR